MHFGRSVVKHGYRRRVTTTPPRLTEDTKIYVAGHRGLVGSALWRAFQHRGNANLIGATSAEVDLRDRDATMTFVGKQRPEVMVIAAAKVGGILANDSYPAEFLSDNLRIQVNLMDAAHEYGVQRLLFLGSSCIYPKFAAQPIAESSLLTGALEPTNDAYAIAKITGILQVQSMRKQYGLPYISAMPTNLYGPGDNFDAAASHVMPALIRKFHDAKQSGDAEVTIWGTGTPQREFLHVDDLAAALIFLLEHYDSPDTINVGTGVDVTIRELAEIIAETVGWEGRLRFDPSKPDGTPRKLLDVSRLRDLGWQAGIGLEDGVRSTYDWYVSNLATARLG
jgi:GDP-L-fucose synthase